MRNILTVFFLFIQHIAFSQGLLTYSSLTIPDSLKKGADAVFRLDETVVEINSASKYTVSDHRIITILNKDGLRHSGIVFLTDKLIKLDEAEVRIYNDLGLEIKKYRKKDFSVVGNPYESSLATDNKYYYLEAPMPEPPFTIEVTSVIKLYGYIDFPDWKFGSSDESFELSRFKIVVPTDLDIRYKAYNTTLTPAVSTDGNNKVYEWQVKNQKIFPAESKSYGSVLTIPRISIAPKYKKMQTDTRYVSIQLGIGGLKPFPASFVEEKKYGDCKALSNYMKHLLKAAGIKSYAAIIKSGKNAYPADPSFPNEGFDHVILCVPNDKDTVWLECTSKLPEPGILGNFTENRNALLITENGGVLVNTPVSKSSDNQWQAKTNVELFDDGSAFVKSRIFVSGEFWEYIYAYTDSKSKDDIKKALVNVFGYKAPDDYELKIVTDSADGHVIQLNMEYRQFFDFKAGAKHFFPLRQYKLNDETIKTAETRKFEYLFDFPYIKSDSTVYKLPGNFKKENLPPNKEIKNNFVFYKTEVQINETGDELKVVTQLTLNKHIIPAQQYNEVANSFESIKKDEGQKIVLKKE
ncbi:MAG: DUF3857 domain-containing protein [Chitinophagaceae bacterium]|nr:DUF3857 domain-containing protein [Chitinophagaceae bacterium]